MPAKRILITGAAGYIGFQLGQRLCQDHFVLGMDIRTRPEAEFPIRQLDIRSSTVANLMAEHRITHVVHLACVVEPSGNAERDYDIDVNGTRNILDACVAQHIQHLTIASSGAAYGYHADNPAWLNESHPLRGNAEFSYAAHKRQVEEILAGYRATQPQLKQLVMRPGTVLGQSTHNMITRLFAGRRLLALSGAPSPFVFIWDQDVLAAMELGIRAEKTGLFNLAGDGAMTLHEIAQRLGKPVLTLPAWLVRSALAVGHSLGLTRYGPSQLNFLRYRPVLDNTALKRDFGFQPQKTSHQTFDFYASHALGIKAPTPLANLHANTSNTSNTKGTR